MLRKTIFVSKRFVKTTRGLQRIVIPFRINPQSGRLVFYLPKQKRKIQNNQTNINSKESDSDFFIPEFFTIAMCVPIILLMKY